MLDKIPTPLSGAICSEKTGWLPPNFDDNAREILSHTIMELMAIEAPDADMSALTKKDVTEKMIDGEDDNDDDDSIPDDDDDNDNEIAVGAPFCCCLQQTFYYCFFFPPIGRFLLRRLRMKYISAFIRMP